MKLKKQDQNILEMVKTVDHTYQTFHGSGKVYYWPATMIK